MKGGADNPVNRLPRQEHVAVGRALSAEGPGLVEGTVSLSMLVQPEHRPVVARPIPLSPILHCDLPVEEVKHVRGAVLSDIQPHRVTLQFSSPAASSRFRPSGHRSPTWTRTSRRSLPRTSQAAGSEVEGWTGTRCSRWTAATVGRWRETALRNEELPGRPQLARHARGL